MENAKNQIVEKINLPAEAIMLHEAEPVTTSLQIAEVFEKLHKNVIRGIEKLQVPDEWHQLNFEPMFRTVEIGNGAKRKEKYYEMTKDGFTLLTMGFSGEKAMGFKIAYIKAFNHMTEVVTQSIETQVARERKALVDTIKEQEIELHEKNKEAVALKRVVNQLDFACDYGDLSPRNGRPRTMPRRPTFTAPPEDQPVRIPAVLVDVIQLRLPIAGEIVR